MCHQELNDEAHLPAKRTQAGPQTWFPQAYANPCRPGHHQYQAPEGPSPTVGLIGRLSHRDDFRALSSDGSTVRRGSLEVRFRPADSAGAGGNLRVAYAISRGVGGAVVRNRIRRRLRAVMSELESRPTGPMAGDYLVRVLPAAAGCGFGDLRRHLTDAVDEHGRRAAR